MAAAFAPAMPAASQRTGRTKSSTIIRIVRASVRSVAEQRAMTTVVPLRELCVAEVAVLSGRGYDGVLLVSENVRKNR